MGSPSKMRGAQGVVLAWLVSASLGGWEDSGEECSGNACFDPASQNIQVVKSKTSSTGLKYKEKSNAKVSVVDMMAVCLPGVDKAFMASSFKSCENKKLTSVCTMKERGWLVADGDETVENEAVLLSAGSGLAGGEEAVRECLKLAEEVDEYEYEYYYYDYADYGDEWDYLEEAGGQVRLRREAGQKTQNERETARKAARREKKKGRQNKTNETENKKEEKKAKKKASKKGKNKDKKKGTGNRSSKKKKGKGGNGKSKEVVNKLKPDLKTARNAAKAVRKEARKAAKEEEKLKKAEEEKKEKERKKEEKKKDLGKLGLKKMPSKSTISRLRCIHTKFSDLMVACAKANLS